MLGPVGANQRIERGLDTPIADLFRALAVGAGNRELDVLKHILILFLEWDRHGRPPYYGTYAVGVLKGGLEGDGPPRNILFRPCRAAKPPCTGEISYFGGGAAAPKPPPRKSSLLAQLSQIF